MLGSFLSLFSEKLISVCGLGYNIVSSIQQGKQLKEISEILSSTHAEIKQLSRSVLYLPSIAEVRRIENGLQVQVSDMTELRDALRPIQRALGGTILSSSALRAPKQLSHAFQDPWEVLIDIRPLSAPKPHPEPNMVPILFQAEGTHYLGWQKRGILPNLLGIEYLPSEFSGTTYAVMRINDNTGSREYFMRKFNILIGRSSPDVWADIRLNTLPDVSREHVRIERTPLGDFRLKDLSKLGTTVNGEPVPKSLFTTDDGQCWDLDQWVELPDQAQIGLANVCFLTFRRLF